MRRTAILIAALVCALPATAEGAPRAADFELRVGDAGPRASAAAHGRAWTSPVLRAPKRFHVFGLRWRGAMDHVHAEVRVRRAGGAWRRWTAVPHGHSARGSDPIWAGGADEVQVRLERRVRGLRLHLVRVTGARTPAPRARRAQAGGRPPIVTREQWGGTTQCAPRDTPTLGTVQAAFVHHTVSANEYGPEDSAAMVLGICRFHRNGNGWDDVGYNFLVDKYGQIFEGRAGGVDQPVVGAQAQGWNSQSTGIANLGTYQDVPQTEQAVSAMASLVAWKLPLHGAPVTGTVDLQSAGGETNRYAKGTIHPFERISGHQDGNRTECPGAQLFAQLPRLRQLAASRAPAVLPTQPSAGSPARVTLAAARQTLSFPEPAQLTGRVTDAAGTGVPDQRVRVQLLTAKGFKGVASAVTDAEGTYTAALPTSRNRTVRVVLGRLRSPQVKVAVAPALQVAAPAERVLAGRRAVLRGTLRPRKGPVVVEVARQGTRPGTFGTPIKVRGAVAEGRFRIPVRLVRPGLHRLRVRFAGDRRNLPAQADFYVRAVRTAAGLRRTAPGAGGGAGVGDGGATAAPADPPAR